MDVLAFALGSRGDVHPFVGLGLALARRGHAVTVAANESFGELIERAGLRFEPVGSRAELNEAFGSPSMWHPLESFRTVISRVILPAMRPQFEVATRALRPESTVLVASTSSLGARIAHDQTGIPLVSVHVQPMVLWSEYRSPVVGPLWLGDRVPRVLKRWQYRLAEKVTVDRWMLAEANAFRNELGLAPLRSMRELLSSPQKVLGLFPSWFAEPQPDWPRQLELADFALWDDAELGEPPADLEGFLSGTDAPIAFTLSSTDWRPREFFTAAVGACRRLGRPGLLLTPNPEHVPDELPADVRRFDYVPFRRLLPRVAALVHHGGLNTAAQAMAAGVPQVTRPACFDQPDNAERLRRLGVSETITAEACDERSLANVLARLLGSDRVSRRCAEIAARMRHPAGLDQACRIIESLEPVVGRRRSRRFERPERAVAARNP